jgi:isoleucyl-tRNA synthetase
VDILPGPPDESAFVQPDVPGVGIAMALADGDKCQRCWKILPEVGGDPAHPGLCRRCADAVDHVRRAAA